MPDNSYNAAVRKTLHKVRASWSNAAAVIVMFCVQSLMYLLDGAAPAILVPLLASLITSWWIAFSLSGVGVHYKMLEVLPVTKRALAGYMVFAGEQLVYIQLAASLAAASLFSNEPYSMFSASVCFAVMLAVYYIFAGRLVKYTITTSESVISYSEELGPLAAMFIIFGTVNALVNSFMPLVGISVGKAAAIVFLIAAWLVLMLCRKKVVDAVEKEMLF